MKKELTAIQIIRKNIKEKLGWNSRQVSIKSDNGTFEKAILITIKVEEAIKDFDKIEEIASSHEKVSYDEQTQEILAGGNTYIHVQVDYDLKHSLIEK